MMMSMIISMITMIDSDGGENYDDNHDDENDGVIMMMMVVMMVLGQFLVVKIGGCQKRWQETRPGSHESN